MDLIVEHIDLIGLAPIARGAYGLAIGNIFQGFT